MKNEIQKLTDSIRNYEDAELSFGTLKTLKMIDDKSKEMDALISNLTKEVERLKTVFA